MRFFINMAGVSLHNPETNWIFMGILVLVSDSVDRVSEALTIHRSICLKSYF